MCPNYKVQVTSKLETLTKVSQSRFEKEKVWLLKIWHYIVHFVGAKLSYQSTKLSNAECHIVLCHLYLRFYIKKSNILHYNFQHFGILSVI